MVTKEDVERVVAKNIRPALSAEGGDIQVVAVDEGNVKIRLIGACASCPMRQYTVTNFIENVLKSNIADIKSVEVV
jgi:Fe-S cluster biogenesis protein NfuA